MFLWNIGTHGRSKDGGYMFFWMLVSTYQMAWVINQRPQYDWYLYFKHYCAVLHKKKKLHVYKLFKGLYLNQETFPYSYVLPLFTSFGFYGSFQNLWKIFWNLALYLCMLHWMCIPIQCTDLPDSEKVNITVFQRKIV
jgi:hypothetical protein